VAVWPHLRWGCWHRVPGGASAGSDAGGKSWARKWGVNNLGGRCGGLGVLTRVLSPLSSLPFTFETPIEVLSVMRLGRRRRGLFS
jgi:hypothetical protein